MTLLSAALAVVALPVLADFLHVHHDHVGDECAVCLHLDHLVLAPAEPGPAIGIECADAPDPGPRADRPRRATLAADPARAPPVLS